jgi:predicted ArsR family transcriptional regulator
LFFALSVAKGHTPSVKIPGWHQRLLASTRGKILALLRAESRTVNELANALELTDNAVRSHLTSLERDGLIQQAGVRRGFRKPHVLYSLSAEAQYLFQTAYGALLRHALTVFGGRLSPQDLQASLRDIGRTVAKDHSDQVKDKLPAQRIEYAVNVLKTLGGDVTLQESDGKHRIVGNGCALSAVTAHHPEACLIAEALLSEIVGVPVKELCQHGKAPHCCFEISS